MGQQRRDRKVPLKAKGARIEGLDCAAPVLKLWGINGIVTKVDPENSQILEIYKSGGVPDKPAPDSGEIIPDAAHRIAQRQGGVDEFQAGNRRGHGLRPADRHQRQDHPLRTFQPETLGRSTDRPAIHDEGALAGAVFIEQGSRRHPCGNTRVARTLLTRR